MVLTTDEMDKLFTPDDVKYRYVAWMQCRKCTKWTTQDMRKDTRPCSNCGLNEFDPTSATSPRSFNPSNKRKVK